MGPAGAAWLRPLDDAGQPLGPARWSPDLAAAVREAPEARLLWASTAECYPRLLRAGVRVARCHDLELTEALLLGHAGRWGQPKALAAGWARLTGAPVPPDPPPRAATPPGDGQGTLFEASWPPPAAGGFDPMSALVEVYRDQQARLAAAGRDAPAVPDAGRRLRLLVAAESAGAVIAAEMGHDGLPWRVDVHRDLLIDLLGEPSPVGGPPRRLAELAARINEAFGDQRLHPESPAEVLRAFAREGIRLPSTRAWVLRGVDHPAVPLLLEFKELYRIWTAHGWSWCQQWVREGRFRPEYVPGGVVSGRWATRGGGALQIPKVVRRAVQADPGWTFVVADAGQLEPRILAAVSSDARMARAAGAGDMYAALATEAFGGDRARAKVALLGAMYGQTGGQAAPALAALRGSYPTALSYVEDAARVGETGGLVRSWLGRTCPPPSVGANAWGDPDAADPEGPRGEAPPDGPVSGAAARARGRFTRNFVIQATAAEWALALLALLRGSLSGSAAELVFFQHDEVVVHCPVADAPMVVAAVQAACERTRRLLFGDTPVRFPLDVSVVDCYAEAK
ncbi:bifunctional 3'-5' exonuclease/DNA polymerase [Rugosimonospora acidiphila]|uniref:bifunctional 3'-5' exonuclease/DNA polymerase n=1 Tax=Rugosimonospora acidiphila TaxID=556531 RepID=UPI0031E70F8C